ncbi:rod shape-determining protein MreC [Thiogranum longum]|uniref:rod shape-determining protein MreC n=1 Tax=Thiogranum longum TaxID=1537524 RepID=UPI00243731CE|nr:rod shape-determining protein MreC [Thiogranum longum]
MFTAGPPLLARLLGVALLSIALMTIDHRQHHLDSVRSALSVVVYPLQLLVDLPGNTIDWFRESLSTRRQLQEENFSLRKQQQVLNTQLQKLEALEAENRHLRALLDSSFQVGERPMLIAALLSVDMDPYRHQIEINKGSLDNLFEGQPLLDSRGIMGQLVHVGPFTSTAMLITDPAHAIPVQVNRNGLRTIALGTGKFDQLELPNIPNNADIQVGDLLVSSGLGGRFPPGYPVAEVTEVEHDPGRAFSLVLARPRAQLDRSREVLLVWPEQVERPPEPVDSDDPAVQENAP